MDFSILEHFCGSYVFEAKRQYHDDTGGESAGRCPTTARRKLDGYSLVFNASY